MPEHSALRPAGTIIMTDWDGKLEEWDTLQCCHCQAHWLVMPGSGRKRGFCMRCGHVTCGSPECDLCVPAELQLDNELAGKPADHHIIQVSVPGNFHLRS